MGLQRHRVEVRQLRDLEGEILAGLARENGLAGVEAVQHSRVYIFEGHVEDSEIDRLASNLLTDSLTQEYCLGQKTEEAACFSFSVCYRPGVKEPILASLKAGLRDLGLSLEALGTADRYIFRGTIEQGVVRDFAKRFIFNPLAKCFGEPGEASARALEPLSHEIIPLEALSEAELLEVSRDRGLALNAPEMVAIAEHFKKLGRHPNLIELETLAQTWSEHCVHKTFKARIEHGDQVIDNLLKKTVVEATDQVDAPYCVSVFTDNAGIVRFDDELDLCFKAETHNHPSAIAPYGGAATGLGGVIRDILGAGLGALPILGMDVFCFGPLDLPMDKLPQGSHHPRRIEQGVVAGVRDYGNRIGLPTSVGAVYYGEGYVANPVVLCGSLGVMPRNTHEKSVNPGDLAVLLGGATGRDGIHGVTFSSESLNAESEELDRSAVQIGDPIVEQMLIDPLMRARDKRLFRCVTDCGGGGLSSALGEMGEATGVAVDLDKVPLKEAGLSPTEIWISESQERMILAVPPESWEELAALFHDEDVLCNVIGRFTGDDRLTLRFKDEVVGSLSMDFLHNGLPRRSLKSSVPTPMRDLQAERPPAKRALDWETALLSCLAHPNVKSKAGIIRQYDHEVQGRGVQGPFAGPNQGPQDATVLLPRLDSDKAAVVAVGFNPLQADMDAYRMAANSIDEAVRNVVATGGDPDRLCLLDNFIWGDVSDAEELGKLVEACLACRDYGLLFEAPFVSGKDSLNNTHVDASGHKRSITPTLIISALTLMDDSKKVVSSAWQGFGNKLYLLGKSAAEFGGSVYFEKTGRAGLGVVPEVDGKAHLALARVLHGAINEGLIESCHDLCEGGLAVAAAEMAFSSGIGAVVELNGFQDLDFEGALFAESSARYIVEVKAENEQRLLGLFSGQPLLAIGETKDQQELQFKGSSEEFSVRVESCHRAWLGQL